MRFATIFASTAIIAASLVSAAAGVTRYAQLRLYTKPDWFESNLGELGIYDADVNTCKTFHDDEVVGSVLFDYNPFGCDLHIYTDATCSAGDHNVKLGECLSGDARYLSYQLKCAV